MAKKPRITKAQQRILDKYAHIREAWSAPDYKPRYGKGSRGPTGPTQYNILQKSVSSTISEYELNRSDQLKLRGMTRRLNNVTKLVKENETIRRQMEGRWSDSDAKEYFNYKDFKDLTPAELGELIELYATRSGIMLLPSLSTPETDTTTLSWNS